MAETTRLWSEIVREMDPREEERPAYEFTGGRKFVQPTPVYRTEPEQG